MWNRHTPEHSIHQSYVDHRGCWSPLVVPNVKYRNREIKHLGVKCCVILRSKLIILIKNRHYLTYCLQKLNNCGHTVDNSVWLSLYGNNTFSWLWCTLRVNLDLGTRFLEDKNNYHCDGRLTFLPNLSYPLKWLIALCNLYKYLWVTPIYSIKRMDCLIWNWSRTAKWNLNG